MPDDYPFNPAEIAERLLIWYADEGRDLPWRHTRDPYRIWLSEIMLQQTTVAAVVPYYEKFLAAFPDIEALAAAPVEAVIELWAGLGYYRRARHLHAAAVKVVEDFGGSFPASPEEILSLPGVGRSTAGAILSIAFDKPAPILDGNVRRVLCRLFALQLPPRSSEAEKLLWSWAEALTPTGRPHDYAQAIMDLGAMVCLPKQPVCPSCPLTGLCQARCRGLERELPLKAATKTVPTVRQVALLLWRDSRLLVRRRPLDGMLQGLWEFPSTDLLVHEGGGDAARRLLAEQGGAGEPRRVGEIRHAYSHFRLELEVWSAPFPERCRVAEQGERRWVDPAVLARTPLHGAHLKAAKLLDSPA